MHYDSMLHAALALAYLEAAVRSFAERQRHFAFRETVVAILYAALALYAS
jgi:hypothetical protein